MDDDESFSFRFELKLFLVEAIKRLRVTTFFWMKIKDVKAESSRRFSPLSEINGIFCDECVALLERSNTSQLRNALINVLL